MKRLIGPVAVVIMFVAVAAAAPQERGPRPRGGRGAPPPPPPPPPAAREDRPDARALVDDLRQRLALTDEQTPQYDAAASEFLDGLDALRNDAGMDRNTLREEIQAARRDGDVQRVQELRAAARDAGQKYGELRRNFVTTLQTFLTDDQKATLEQFRSEQADRRRGEVRQDIEARLQALPDELNLSPEQRTQYDELLATRRAALDENRKKVQPLVQELRDARASGDDARVQELQKQIQDSRASTGGPDGFFSQLDSILTPEQKAKLATLRATGAPPTGQVSPQRIIGLVRELDLSSQQKKQVDDIVRDFRRENGRMSAGRDAQAKLSSALVEKLKAALTPEQSKQFDDLLAKAAHNGPRGPRGDQGDRPPPSREPRGDRRPPPDDGDVPPPDAPEPPL